MRTPPRLTLVTSALVAAGLVGAPALACPGQVRAEGPLVRYSDQVPVGASASVRATQTGSGATVVVLHVRGLLPNTAYGAHAHVNACGATGAEAGPHYQHVVNPDPTRPGDPAYANPDNEIWLDFTTDGHGDGVAQTRQGWQFSADRRPHSVIVHAEGTHTGPTDSGTAGARLACLTVGF